MDYGSLISKAFKITLKHKFLWFLGILASITSGGANITTYNFNLPDLSPYLRKQTPPSWKMEPEGIKVLGVEAVDWISAHFYLILIVAVVLLLFFIFLYVISTMAKAGLIASVLKIEKNEPVSFGIGFKEGYHAFWRMFGIGILISLLVLGTFLILGLPVFGLILLKIYWFALALGLLFLLILLLISIYLSILFMYAIRFTVCQAKGVFESIKSAHNLMMKFRKEVILVWLISIGIGLGIGIALAIISLLVFLPLLAVGIGIYATLGLGLTLIFSLVFGLVILFALLLFSGIFNTFLSSFWTFAYLELNKNKVEI